MRERPILFSGPMVRALRDGTKTQTRRVVKNVAERQMQAITLQSGKTWLTEHHRDRLGLLTVSPYGYPGDRLWVRETWQYADWSEDGQPFVRYAADNAVRFCEGAGEGETLVDVWAELSAPNNYAIDNKAADRKWRPSIFMPRWASRITLEITDVRVQRVQDISEADVEAEGTESVTYCETCNDSGSVRTYGEGGVLIGDNCPYCLDVTPTKAYARLWHSTNEKRAPWASNPWVWALTFTTKRAP